MAKNGLLIWGVYLPRNATAVAGLKEENMTRRRSGLRNEREGQ